MLGKMPEDLCAVPALSSERIHDAHAPRDLIEFDSSTVRDWIRQAAITIMRSFPHVKRSGRLKAHTLRFGMSYPQESATRYGLVLAVDANRVVCGCPTEELPPAIR